MQTHDALEPSALQIRPAPQWILMHGSTICEDVNETAFVDTFHQIAYLRPSLNSLVPQQVRMQFA